MLNLLELKYSFLFVKILLIKITIKLEIISNIFEFLRITLLLNFLFQNQNQLIIYFINIIIISIKIKFCNQKVFLKYFYLALYPF